MDIFYITFIKNLCLGVLTLENKNYKSYKSYNFKKNKKKQKNTKKL